MREDDAREAIELAATFSVPFQEDDARWMLAFAGASENVLDVLLGMASRAENLSAGQEWGAIERAPETIRRFVESVARSLEAGGADGTK